MDHICKLQAMADSIIYDGDPIFSRKCERIFYNFMELNIILIKQINGQGKKTNE